MDDPRFPADLPTAAPSTAAPSPLAILETWPRAAGAVTGATVVCSVLYNWAYFEVAYPSGIQLLSLTDHVASALEWLPGSVLSYALSMLINFGIGYPRSPTPPMPRGVARIAAASLGALTAVAYLFTTRSEWMPFVAVMEIWWIWFAVKMSRLGVWRGHVATFMIIGSLLLMSSLTSGNSRGLSDFIATKGNATVALKDGSAIENALVLRQLDKGILVRQVNSDKIMFFRWDDVSRVVVSGIDIDRQWRVCLMFSVFCGMHEPMH